MNVDEKPILTSAEVCSMLNIHRSSLWKLEKAGKLEPIWLLGNKRFTAENVRSLISSAPTKRDRVA